MLEVAEDLETGHWRAGDGDAAYGGDDVACDAVVAVVVGDFVLAVPSGWHSEAKGVAAAVADSGSDFASDAHVDLNAADARADSALGDARQQLEQQQPQPSY
jgi:hypothetical protein